MKKYIVIWVTGILILCGVGVAAVPNHTAQSSDHTIITTSQKTFGRQAALEITITGGIGITVSIKNIGVEDAINVRAEININYGLIKMHTITVQFNTSSIAPGESAIHRSLPLGIGAISVLATAHADNAVETTEGEGGVLLLFYVHITWH